MLHPARFAPPYCGARCSDKFEAKFADLSQLSSNAYVRTPPRAVPARLSLHGRPGFSLAVSGGVHHRCTFYLCSLTHVNTLRRYSKLKNEVIKSERRILKELGFCVHLKHPHKLIISYLKLIGTLRASERLGGLAGEYDCFSAAAIFILILDRVHSASIDITVW